MFISSSEAAIWKNEKSTFKNYWVEQKAAQILSQQPWTSRGKINNFNISMVVFAVWFCSFCYFQNFYKWVSVKFLCRHCDMPYFPAPVAFHLPTSHDPKGLAHVRKGSICTLPCYNTLPMYDSTSTSVGLHWNICPNTHRKFTYIGLHWNICPNILIKLLKYGTHWNWYSRSLKFKIVNKKGVPYIRNFSSEFNFCWVRDLPEIPQNIHSEK